MTRIYRSPVEAEGYATRVKTAGGTPYGDRREARRLSLLGLGRAVAGSDPRRMALPDAPLVNLQLAEANAGRVAAALQDELDRVRQEELDRETLRARGEPGTVFRPRKSRECAWPFGEPRAAGFRFCGEETAPGRTYCDTCYERSITRKGRNGA